jgi:hypothetical protein
MNQETVNQEKSSIVLQCGLPLLVGFLIEISSDLLKHATHYVITSVFGDLSLGIFEELRQMDFWIAITVAIGLVAMSLWILECWTRAHPKLWVRITLVIIAVIFAGAIDPIGRVFKDRILIAYDKAQVGEPMGDVLDRFQYDSGIVIVPNKDKKRHDELDCIGECWLRLIYEVPVIIGERWVTLEFGHDQKLVRKCNMDGKCLPERKLGP